MSMVNWTNKKHPINSRAGDDRDSDLIVGVLKLDIEKNGPQWKGKAVCVKKEYTVELRKHIGHSDVLILITDRGTGIRMSMNCAAQFTPAQLNEMNLAILEGQVVLENLTKK